ncbi:cancer-related nucleoside-triphosphatase homolog [Caerostris extrusa]|uniref:Cancer-related nucleoside-triphosphatase homolog n=1 Tax=Caerostris extrusa TaxID=172846 RepID=A0AAV4PPZ8_CAEEX|nr:cancer-related nucleoside-triphosphatase homolog [Caerostris extrusa]
MSRIGKTSVIRKACEILKEKNIEFQGFFTEEVKNGRERIGFDIVTTLGKRNILARVSDSSARKGPKVGKYTVDVSSFEALVLPVFDAPSSILILDEIGKMELFSKPFLAKAQEVFSKSNVRVLATIPVVKRVLPFVDELRNRKDCIVIEVTRENRNNLPHEIVQQLLQT